MPANNRRQFFRQTILGVLNTQSIVRVSNIIVQNDTTKPWPWCWVRIVDELYPEDKRDADGRQQIEATAKFYIEIGAKASADTQATGTLDDAIDAAVDTLQIALHSPVINPRSQQFTNYLVRINDISVDELQAWHDDRAQVANAAIVGNINFTMYWK